VIAAGMRPFAGDGLLADSAVLVPVPTAAARARRRGYDQARLLARELSRRTGLPYLDCLARHGNAHQVGASGGTRRSQLQGVFRVTVPGARLRGARLVLIDDVMTTGATLEAAAAALTRAGAAHMEGLVFARA
jgi:ComF family protein